MTFSDGLCDGCAVRTREEWGLPAATSPRPDHGSRAWRHAFPYATVALAACITGVAFALVVGPPKHATGPPRPATALTTPRVDVAAAPVPDHGAPTLPRVATRTTQKSTTPRAQDPTEEAAVAPEPARAVVATPARSRAGVVRVRDRRVISVAVDGVAVDGVATQSVATTAAAEPIVVAMAPWATEWAMLYVAGPPALVELQVP